MAKHIHVHVGTKDAEPYRAEHIQKMKKSKDLLSEARKLLGYVADGSSDADIRKASTMAYQGCVEAVRHLSGF